MAELRWDGVSVVRRRVRILDDFSLCVGPGQAVALVGPNGAGKSTALLAGLGAILPSAGEVLLNGRPIARCSRAERAAHIAWLPQETAPPAPLMAWEWIAAGRYRFGEGAAAARRAALAALDAVDASALGPRLVTTLSGGERQRVALAALFAQESSLLFVDEPASHLDPVHQMETFARLGGWVQRGGGLIVVTHDVNVLDALRHPVDVVGLRAGAIAFRATYPASDLGPSLTDLFGVPFAAFTSGPRRFYAPGSHAESSRH